MQRNRDISIIVGSLKGLFVISAILMALMMVLSIIFEEPMGVMGFLAGLIVSLTLAVAIHFLVPEYETLDLKHAIIIAALAYIFIPAVSSIPLIISTGMVPIDAFFEAMSGWTGSGFSLIIAPDRVGRSIQLWRSLMQWIGGAGVILLMVTILIRPGTSTYVLYQSEARKEKIKPSIRSTLKTIWKLYMVLTIISVLLLFVAGMPLWDSLNTAMVTIATGGFGLYADSIAHYNSPVIELILILIMIAGSLPFAVLYTLFRYQIHTLLHDAQVRAFAAFVIVGGTLLVVQNSLFQYDDAFNSLRYSVFQFVSAVTTCGLQTTDLSGWSPTALMILSIAMIIGGCAGSTAGGIKIARAIFLVNQVRLWLIKTLMSKKAVVVLKLGEHKVVEQSMTAELNEATLISFLWIVNIVLSVMLLSNILGTDVSLSRIIFEVCSAQGNVGISSGILTPAISPLAKGIFIVDMWMGRLEIVPVILLVRAVVKGFGRY
ncbi:TrkH family potassium uptake protein [Methanocella sp. MCL-LM]|uniref:TrkH family potassium uptake protein n=1 Tax=Methanocella sp. MCL-LM TaxID=3412035 RepID=UPI003C750FFC